MIYVYIYITVPRMNPFMFFPMVAETVVLFRCEKPGHVPNPMGHQSGGDPQMFHLEKRRALGFGGKTRHEKPLGEFNGWNIIPSRGNLFSQIMFRNLTNG